MAVVKQNTFQPGVNNDVTNVCVNVDLNRIGTDLSQVVWSGTQYVLKAGTLVEANGSLYANDADINLGNTSGDLDFNSSTLAFSIGTGAATYNPAKGGLYVSANVRRLKWGMVSGGTFGIRENKIGLGPAPVNNTGYNVGDLNTSTAENAQAFGRNNNATNINTAAFGVNNTAGGSSASASGQNNNSSGALSSAHGQSNISAGLRSSAMGNANIASGENSSGMGRSNEANALRSSAHGNGNTASGTDSSAHGRANVVSNTDASAFGMQVTASGLRASGFGNGSTASGTDSAAMGRGNTASGTNSSASGRSNTASAIDASAFGRVNAAEGDRSSAFGYSNAVSSSDGAAFGNACQVTATGGTAFGVQVSIRSTLGTALGYLNSNIKIINKNATQGQVYEELQLIGTAVGTTAPAIYFESFTFDGGTKTGIRQLSAFVYKTSSSQWDLYNASTGISIKGFVSGDPTAIGNSFILLDIAR
jgi:hypothetical protein